AKVQRVRSPGPRFSICSAYTELSSTVHSRLLRAFRLDHESVSFQTPSMGSPIPPLVDSLVRPAHDLHVLLRHRLLRESGGRTWRPSGSSMTASTRPGRRIERITT